MKAQVTLRSSRFTPSLCRMMLREKRQTRSCLSLTIQALVLALALTSGVAAAADRDTWDSNSWTREALVGLKKFSVRTVVDPDLQKHGLTDHVIADLVSKTAAGSGFSTVEWKTPGGCKTDCSGFQIFVWASDPWEDDSGIERVRVSAQVTLTDDAPIRGHLAHVVFYDNSASDVVMTSDVRGWASTRVQQMVTDVVEAAFAANRGRLPQIVRSR